MAYPVAADEGMSVYYRSFNDELETTAAFAEMGITNRCFFAANTVNSLGNPYCQYPLIWKGFGKYDWKAFDAQAERLLKASPNARFMVIVDLNTPDWLRRRFGYDSYDSISRAASDPAWRKETLRWMHDFFAYAEKSRFADRISGYVLSAGGTSEWYEYERGEASDVKTAAWRDWCKARGLDYGPSAPSHWELKHPAFDTLVYDPATQAKCVDWWRFHNWIVADAICTFAAEARKDVPRPKRLGVFFGYFFVRNTKITTFGHLGYERVYDSPNLDFVIAPGNYEDRGIGGGGGTQLVHGSAALRGKPFLHEIDFAPNAYGWKMSADRLAGNTREAAFALVNHADSWWFDMWGHFYDDPNLRERIARLKTISDRFATDTSPSAAEVLLVADPQSMAFIDDKSPKGNLFGQDFRNHLGRTGLPFDVLSFNDLATADLSRYRVIFLQATLFIDAAREKLLNERVFRDGRTVAFEYAPGIADGKTLDVARVKRFAGVDFGTKGVSVTPRDGWTAAYAPDLATWSSAAMRKICLAAGVHGYLDEPAVVYANARLVSVHVAQGGKKTIRLPRKVSEVTELVSGKTVPVVDGAFDWTFDTPDTRIFELPSPELVLRLSPGPGNCRNSEGDFIVRKDGAILFAYTRFLKGNANDHDHAEIACRVSTDGGRTWPTNDVILVRPEPSDQNVMSVSLFRRQNGDMAMVHLRKRSERDCRPVIRCSSDEGRTWSEPRGIVPDGEVSYYVLNNSRVIRLASGRLLLALAQHGTPPGVPYQADWTGRIVTYYSDDDGLTWRRSRSELTNVGVDGKRHAAQEPGVIELKDGRVLLYIRSDSGRQWFAYSSDGGESWSPSVPSPLHAPDSPARLHRLADGRLLAVFNDYEHVTPEERMPSKGMTSPWRTPLTLAVSSDEGRTWPIRRNLETKKRGWFCYPAVLEQDDSLLLAYCAEGILAGTWIKRVPLDWIERTMCSQNKENNHEENDPGRCGTCRAADFRCR